MRSPGMPMKRCGASCGRLVRENSFPRSPVRKAGCQVTEHMQKTIEFLAEEITKKEKEILLDKQLVNRLCVRFKFQIEGYGYPGVSIDGGPAFGPEGGVGG